MAADFSGDKTTRVGRVVSPFDGVMGEVTPAQREVQEELLKRQVTAAPEAAHVLNKESVMSNMTAAPSSPADKKSADAILNGAAVIGATPADQKYSPAAVMAADAKVFGKKTNAA